MFKLEYAQKVFWKIFPHAKTAWRKEMSNLSKHVGKAVRDRVASQNTLAGNSIAVGDLWETGDTRNAKYDAKLVEEAGDKLTIKLTVEQTSHRDNHRTVQEKIQHMHDGSWPMWKGNEWFGFSKGKGSEPNYNTIRSGLVKRFKKAVGHPGRLIKK